MVKQFFQQTVRLVTETAPGHHFVPIPEIWQFHLIYLCVTLMLALCFFPYAVFVSLFMVASMCSFGLMMTAFKRHLTAHVLALAIGLGTPVVVLGGLVPFSTAILFGTLVSAIALFNKVLF